MCGGEATPQSSFLLTAQEKDGHGLAASDAIVFVMSFSAVSALCMDMGYLSAELPINNFH